jgi:very-short-patch-repair endonuclease
LPEIAQSERALRGPGFTIDHLIEQQELFQQGIQLSSQKQWKKSEVAFRRSIALGDCLPQPWEKGISGFTIWPMMDSVWMINGRRPRRMTAPTRALELRRNPTPAETKLWSRLRAHQLAGVGFRRQHAIGPFIVDFCAPREKLIIEVDGSQHLDQEEYDAERTAYLEIRGYQVMRFFNNQVENDIEAVLQAIYNVVSEKNDV